MKVHHTEVWPRSERVPYAIQLGVSMVAFLAAACVYWPAAIPLVWPLWYADKMFCAEWDRRLKERGLTEKDVA